MVDFNPDDYTYFEIGTKHIYTDEIRAKIKQAWLQSFASTVGDNVTYVAYVDNDKHCIMCYDHTDKTCWHY